MVERELSQFVDAFDLFNCIDRIVKHKHIDNLKGLRKVIDNRIKELEDKVKLKANQQNNIKINSRNKT